MPRGARRLGGEDAEKAPEALRDDSCAEAEEVEAWTWTIHQNYSFIQKFEIFKTKIPMTKVYER